MLVTHWKIWNLGSDLYVQFSKFFGPWIASEPDMYNSSISQVHKILFEVLFPLGFTFPGSTLFTISWSLLVHWNHPPTTTTSTTFSSYSPSSSSLESFYFIYPALLCTFHDCPCLGMKERKERKFSPFTFLRL